jgi:DNA-binding NarL/FixJ family response regulator
MPKQLIRARHRLRACRLEFTRLGDFDAFLRRELQTHRFSRPGILTRATRRMQRGAERGAYSRSQHLGGMASTQVSEAPDRVQERRRAVVLAQHFREAEGLPIAQIAQRLDRSSATIKAYFYDPTGEKARAVKRRYQ